VVVRRFPMVANDSTNFATVSSSRASSCRMKS
jgi:hypothetical protein